VLERIRERAGSLRAGPVVVLDEPANDPAVGPADAAREPAPAAAEARLPGDLVVRTTPDIRLRHGLQVPLLVDLAHLFVFDRHGERICPAPARLPDLAE
jgi:multiple sugar transport system ATP-binding protein